jgi:hypothetical protein
MTPRKVMNPVSTIAVEANRSGMVPNNKPKPITTTVLVIGLQQKFGVPAHDAIHWNQNGLLAFGSHTKHIDM